MTIPLSVSALVVEDPRPELIAVALPVPWYSTPLYFRLVMSPFALIGEISGCDDNSGRWKIPVHFEYETGISVDNESSIRGEEAKGSICALEQ